MNFISDADKRLKLKYGDNRKRVNITKMYVLFNTYYTMEEALRKKYITVILIYDLILIFCIKLQKTSRMWAELIDTIK